MMEGRPIAFRPRVEASKGVKNTFAAIRRLSDADRNVLRMAMDCNLRP